MTGAATTVPSADTDVSGAATSSGAARAATRPPPPSPAPGWACEAVALAMPVAAGEFKLRLGDSPANSIKSTRVLMPTNQPGY